MTASEQVVRTQRFLQAASIVTSLLWGITVSLLVLGITALVQWTSIADRPWPDGWVAALVLGAITFLAMLWRGRFARHPRRVALWIEERIPDLQYALVTASDPSVTLDTAPLEVAVGRSRVDRLVAPALLAPVGRAAAVAASAGLALVLTSTVTGARLRFASHSALTRIGIAAPLPNRLAALTVRIVPPSYAGAAARVINDPSGVTALVGSTIAVMGFGGRGGIGAALQNRQLGARGAGDAWELSFTMPRHAATLSLTDRGFHRAIAVIPVVDQPPTVSMTSPTRDSVWRTAPRTTINFAARATDDIGLDRGYFEYTVTSGAGEIFKARSANFGASSFGGSGHGEMHAALSLPPLNLAAGDVLSIRAVVTDGNTVTGPGTTTSDTRTFRVARADEYDSLAVEGAPPPPMERSMLTERMLIISAESLLKQRAPLGRTVFVESAGRIGVDQASLRKRVYDIVYGHEEAGGTTGVEGDDEELDPQLVINRDLKEAYDAMWDAERALMVGDVTPALPSMQKALRALDRARLANRLYLRGRPPRVIVNVEKVRLAGKEKGTSSNTAPRSRADTVVEQQRRSFDHALELARNDPSAFSDELTRLRAEAATTNNLLSSALGDAVDAIHTGRDATPALVRARRALSGAVRVGNAAAPWVGAWSVSR